jgi:hypothetical protein
MLYHLEKGVCERIISGSDHGSSCTLEVPSSNASRTIQQPASVQIRQSTASAGGGNDSHSAAAGDDDDIHEPVVSSENDTDTFECSCGRSYRKSESLYMHIESNNKRTGTTTRWPNFKCSCGNIYKHYRTLESHIKSTPAAEHKFDGRTFVEDTDATRKKAPQSTSHNTRSLSLSLTKG